MMASGLVRASGARPLKEDWEGCVKWIVEEGRCAWDALAHGEPALIHALKAAKSAPWAAPFLLELGAPARPKKALDCAIANGNVEAARKLFDLKAQRTKEPWAAALHSGNPGMCALLLERGYDPRAPLRQTPSILRFPKGSSAIDAAGQLLREARLNGQQIKEAEEMLGLLKSAKEAGHIRRGIREGLSQAKDSQEKDGALALGKSARPRL